MTLSSQHSAPAAAPARPTVGDRIRAAVFTSCRAAAPGERAPNGEAFDVLIVASTGRVARDRGIIEASAWSKDLRFFRSNPVIQWAHDYRLPPIATAVDVQIAGSGQMLQWWRFLTGLSDDAWDAFAGRIRVLYAVGGMRAASVGWIGREYRDPNDEDKKAALAAGEPDPYWVCARAELLETSAVPVPADPYALAVERAIFAAERVGQDMKLMRTAWDSMKQGGQLPAELLEAAERAASRLPRVPAPPQLWELDSPDPEAERLAAAPAAPPAQPAPRPIVMASDPAPAAAAAEPAAPAAAAEPAAETPAAAAAPAPAQREEPALPAAPPVFDDLLDQLGPRATAGEIEDLLGDLGLSPDDVPSSSLDRAPAAPAAAPDLLSELVDLDPSRLRSILHEEIEAAGTNPRQ